MSILNLGPNIALHPQDLAPALQKPVRVNLSNEALEAVVKGRNFLENAIEKSIYPIYGINTGFGSLCNVEVGKSELAQLQENLVTSHACGMGEEIEPELVRIMLILKIQSLAYGHSGIRLETIQQLVHFVNHDILPVVYESGSLGASGDLAPLAHISLALMGKGDVWYKGKRIKAEIALQKCGLSPIGLAAKEGLALLNGTQFMSAYLTAGAVLAARLLYQSDLIAALSLEAFDGRPEPFTEAVHRVRPHAGQLFTAARIRQMLEGSSRISQPKKHVQDPYSFRCIPQVHGASKDTLRFALQTLIVEINAVTDNPTLFPDEDMIISAGNFHGQPLALALDYLSIAMAEIGNISERRTFLLNSGQRNLPAFLTPSPGLNSGMMIAQYTAASLVSKNKQLCTPASVDSIVSSNGQEDHVSMGANAAVKMLDVLDNVEAVLAVELVNAAQAMPFSKVQTSPFLSDFYREFSQHVPFMEKDGILYERLHTAQSFLRSMTISPELLWEGFSENP
ncbi:MAG: histidine ammonia-lyase [Cryomorphaceae bacterium]|nr:histidine ammonia-lyase [Cryomorphaceae bacterium]